LFELGKEKGDMAVLCSYPAYLEGPEVFQKKYFIQHPEDKFIQCLKM
jgi:hypothetical protein